MLAVDEIGKGGVEALNEDGKVRNGREEIQLILSSQTRFVSPFNCDILKPGFYASKIKITTAWFKIMKPEYVKNTGWSVTAVLSVS